MKILGVRFLNLNSLKGLHEIRFDQSPLADAGLFAITGPTGAGKTTLLDAITVGLFGRVHRHDRDAFEIMTRHTGESFSEVEFEVKDKKYRSKWSIYRSRKKTDGKLQPIHMELLTLPDQKLMDLKPSEVPVKVAEISGLDYSQFLRSVILSQGDFTRFLKASESERSDLLEKITDTGIYSRISVWAYRQADKEKKTLEFLRAKLDNSELLTEEQVATFQAQVADLQSQIQGQQKIKQDREQQANWLMRLEQLQQKKTGLAAELQVLTARFEAQQSEFIKLQQHQRALQFKPALVEIRSSQNQAQQLDQNLLHIARLLPNYEQQTQEAEQRLALSRQQVLQAQQELEAAEPIFHEVTRQDSIIARDKEHFLKNRQNYIQAGEELEKLKQLLIAKQTTLQQIQLQLEQTQNWLQQNQPAQFLDREIITYQQGVKDLRDIHRKLKEALQEYTEQEAAQKSASQIIQHQKQQLEQDQNNALTISAQITLLQQTSQNLLAGKSFAELENTCNELPARIRLLEQQSQLAQQYQQITNKLEILKQSIQVNKTEQQQANQATNELITKKQHATETLQHLQQIVDLQRQIQKYEADRELLQPHQPCPLCGSEHHPFVLNQYHSNVTEAEQKCHTQQQVVAELIDQQTILALHLSSLQALLVNEQKQVIDLQTEQTQIVSKFKVNQEQIPDELVIYSEVAILDLLLRYQSLYQEKKELLTKLRQNEEEYRRLEKIQQEQKEITLRREHEIIRAQEKEEQAVRQMQYLQTDLTDLKEQQLVVSEQIQSFLLRFNITFTLDKSQEIEAKLQQLAKAFAGQTEQVQKLNLTLKQTETEQANLQENITEKGNLLQQNKIQLQKDQAHLQQLLHTRQQLFGTKMPQTERERLKTTLHQQTQLLENLHNSFLQKQEQMRLAQSRQQQWQTELTRVQAQVTTLTTELHHSVQAHNIDSVETLVQLFLTDDEAHRIELLQKQAERALAENQKLYADTEQELNQEQTRQLTNSSLIDLQTEIENLNTSIARLHQQIGSLQRQLEQDAEVKAKYHETAAQVDIQQKEFLRWDKMASLIGSADGKKFSKFAQGLTLAHLTELANRHLVKLNERYRIFKTPTQDLELQIIDTYQADAVRSMNTLSGGESFLVSLALALGLSDLAGRKAQINSLFIDEGFGTLDTDTLDIAISALENLQAGGKLIGVISHVEALKERISTQIQVNKQASGQSFIKIVGYETEAYA
ncbi:SbcC/MukB-like Walker B domain-containing protein [Adhaeribacter radiodurans]|uniref:ATP-binding cassette family protein n=1 Tax=Adhaeribacter radiodurans TaxID=2745197 RepID=A0A7L7L388_9BACT|nr:SbcC/MukB-like Walker B domain-containing protein [Adhaeribacter radiodurans]QMU27233.1 ATP-binding cassette family protein [Adhaeribacter radiodurans]